MRVRLFGLLTTIAFAISVSPAHGQQPVYPTQLPSGPGNIPGHGYINVQQPMLMLEHLVHHSDNLVTNINLTRASGFRIEQVVIDGIVGTPCWAASFYTDVIAAIRRPEAPDLVGFAVGQLTYTFRMDVIGLYDIAMNAGPGPDLAKQFEKVNFSYFNAISATYFYIEALRRGLVLPQLPQPLRNKALLMKRLQMLERNAAEVQNLMYMIRYAAPFRFPIGRNCLECAFAPVRINVMAQGPQEVLFPYYANQRVNFPDQQVRRVEAPARYNPMYQTEVWNNRWNTIDQGYLNPGAGNMNGGGSGYSGSGGGSYGNPPGNNGGQQLPANGGSYGNSPGNNGGQQLPANGGRNFVQPYSPANGGQQLPANGGQQLPANGQSYGPQPLNNGGQQPVAGQQPVDNGTAQPAAQGGTTAQPLPTMPAAGTTTGNYTPGAYDY